MSWVAPLKPLSQPQTPGSGPHLLTRVNVPALTRVRNPIIPINPLWNGQPAGSTDVVE